MAHVSFILIKEAMSSILPWIHNNIKIIRESFAPLRLKDILLEKKRSRILYGEKFI
jgi:hypothetical protein